MSHKCWICCESISEKNDTKEHIIPNSIGGRKTISGFICCNCNSHTGETWDAELSKQFSWLSSMFEINRQRGKIPPIEAKTTMGTVIKINPGLKPALAKPSIEESEENNKITLNVIAPDKRTLRQAIEGLKRKHPQINVEETVDSAQFREEYLEGLAIFGIEFGSIYLAKSAIKSSLAIAFDSGLSMENCMDALNYIRSDEADTCYGLYYDSDLLEQREVDMPIHCIAVHADNQSGHVLAYVEYFGIYRIVVRLGDDYKGPNKTNIYALDPRMNSKIEDLKINFKKIEINLNNIILKNEDQVEKAINNISNIIGPQYSLLIQKEYERRIEDLVRRSLKETDIKEGDKMNEELINIISHNLAPLLVSRLTPINIKELINSDQENELPLI